MLETQTEEDKINKVEIITKFQRSEVVVGGQLNLSRQEALDLYNFTTVKPPKDGDDNVNQDMFISCRDILRGLAKHILIGDVSQEVPKDFVTNFLK